MANGNDDRKSSWLPGLTPGDVRRAGIESPQQSLDSDAKRQVSLARHEQSSQLGQREHDDPEFNPFIAFKQFVDDRITAIAEWPSKITDLRRQAREVNTAHEDLKRAHYRWTGRGGDWMDDLRRLSSDLAPDLHEEAKGLAGMLLRESDWRNRIVPSEKIIALCKDEEFNPNRDGIEASPSPFLYRVSYNQSQENGRPSTIACLSHWLSVNWFKHNPYSPVNLEIDPVLAQYETKWRHAFEDLLEASLDKPMTSRDRNGSRPFSGTAVSTWRGPGRDWMFSLRCRGILPPQLPSVYSQGGTATEYSTSPEKENLGDLKMAHADIDLLVREIAATATQDGVGVKSGTSLYEGRQMVSAEAECDAEEAEFDSDEQICPRHTEHQSSEDHAYEMSLAERNHRDQMSDYDEASPFANRCPDELGREVGQAARQSNTEVTELDMYEAQCEYEYTVAQHKLLDLMEAGWPSTAPVTYEAQVEFVKAANRLSDLASEKYAMDDLDAPLDDESSRCSIIEAAARRRAARAFIDEENGLDEYAAGRGRRCLVGGNPPPARSLQDPINVSPKSSARDMTFQDVYERDTSYLMDQVHGLWAEQDRLQRRVADLAIEQKALVERQEVHEQKQTTRLPEQKSRVADQSFLPSFPARSDRPQVLSTLTTTQTTRLPDGSVKTTVVLKRRFADGGEETQESTQTSFEEPAAAGGAVRQEPSKERKSWFWS